MRSSFTLSRAWLIAVGWLLLGYTFSGRGFAHLGVGPIYVGEVVLSAGVLVSLLLLAMSPTTLTATLRSPLTRLWVLFALLGAARTIPFVSTYGLDALRDAALWGYGLFSLLVGTALLRSGWIIKVVQSYRRCILPFLIWAPVALALRIVGLGVVSPAPGLTVPLIDLKGGDVAVHLAGIMSFMLLGLRRYRHEGVRTQVSDVVVYVLWCCSFVMVATGRAAIVTLLASVLAVIVFSRKTKWKRPALVVGIIVLLFTGLGIRVPFPAYDREISAEQLLRNARSLVGITGHEELDGPRQWRLQWWQTIIGYTIYGDYFWTGKGFGINLADDDGFQVNQDHSLRSPHNSHLTVLARMGVPGFTIWVVLQIWFAIALLRASALARRVRKDWWARLDLWLFAYWLAFVVNGCFDVFLEGPHGGISFWCLFGFGIAVLQYQRQCLPAEPRDAAVTGFKIAHSAPA